jgi:hypothetical protein
MEQANTFVYKYLNIQNVFKYFHLVLSSLNSYQCVNECTSSYNCIINGQINNNYKFIMPSVYISEMYCI